MRLISVPISVYQRIFGAMNVLRKEPSLPCAELLKIWKANVFSASIQTTRQKAPANRFDVRLHKDAHCQTHKHTCTYSFTVQK